MMKNVWLAVSCLLLAATAFGQTISEVDLSIPAAQGFRGFFFRNYYVSPSTGREGYVSPAPFGQLHDSVPIRDPNGTYLIVTAYGLGDIFQLDGIPGPQPPVQPPTPPTQPPPPNPPVQPPQPQQGCAPLNVASFFIAFQGPSGCSFVNTAACSIGESIAFNAANDFSYDPGCGPHTYRWIFGDGVTASTRTPSHAYAVGTRYDVQVQVTNPRSTFTYTATVRVMGEGPQPPQPPQPCSVPAPPPDCTWVLDPGGDCTKSVLRCPPPDCPPPPPCPACPVCPVCPAVPPVKPPEPPVVQPPNPTSGCLASAELFYSGEGDDPCRPQSGEACTIGEGVTFSVIGVKWFECGSRTVAFDFGDGGKELTTNTDSRPHHYDTKGTYTARATVTVDGQTKTLTQTVEVQP